jgi:hypothetical protein
MQINIMQVLIDTLSIINEHFTCSFIVQFRP